MRGALDLIGALSIAAGLLTALLVFLADNLVPLWVPGAYLLGGFMSSLVWFALSGIIRRLDEIQIMVGKPSR